MKRGKKTCVTDLDIFLLCIKKHIWNIIASAFFFLISVIPFLCVEKL
jgi:hypothetical protein